MIKFFKITWWNKKRKCVSPPSVGAVLVLCCVLCVPLQVNAAAEDIKVLFDTGTSYSESIMPDNFTVVYDGADITFDADVTGTNTQGDSRAYAYSYYVNDGDTEVKQWEIDNGSTYVNNTVTGDMVMDLTGREYGASYSGNVSFKMYSSLLDKTGYWIGAIDFTLGCKGLKALYIYDGEKMQQVPYYSRIGDNYRFVLNHYSIPFYASSHDIYFYLEYDYEESGTLLTLNSLKSTCVVTCTVNDFNLTGFYGYVYGQHQVIEELQDNEQAINNQTRQDKQFHDQDQADATQAGQDMAGLGTQLETVKNKWAILWYPIEFTNSVFSAFQGSTSETYSRAYTGISGYTYDEKQGLLVPVYSKTREGPSEGTLITFPSYTLPVIDLQIWDEYTFDLSTVKDDFPLVFDMLYVVVTILEAYWFVSFLKSKFDEVFG